MKVSVNELLVKEEDKESVIKTLDAGWFSSAGPVIPEFEDLWANYCNRQFGVAVSNGSTALLAAFLALKLPLGSEVIIPNFTIISCANAVIQSGLVPIFVDCELNTFNMDPSKIEAKISKSTRAILVVHIYGHPSDVEKIQKVAEKHNLLIIEDAAEAHGAKYLDLNNNWKVCGTDFHLSTFSFFANKVITTGEGGMILTDNETYAKELKSIRNLYFPDNREYKHSEIGYQFRMSSLQAAFGIPQIGRINEILKRKTSINLRYRDNLQNIEKIEFSTESARVKPNYWVIPIMLDQKFMGSLDFRMKLLENNIETRPFFAGMNEQLALTNFIQKNPKDFLNSRKATAQGVILPSGINTTNEQIDYVCDVISHITK